MTENDSDLLLRRATIQKGAAKLIAVTLTLTLPWNGGPTAPDPLA